jgi:hypothetical protein
MHKSLAVNNLPVFKETALNFLSDMHSKCDEPTPVARHVMLINYCFSPLSKEVLHSLCNFISCPSFADV